MPQKLSQALIIESLRLPSRLAIGAIVLGAVAAVCGLLWSPSEPKAASAVLAFALTWASFVDIDRLILPDVLTIGLVVVGVALHAGNGIAGTIPFVIGAAVGFAAIAVVAVAYKRVRGHAGLGMGDAKLLAAGGAWLGWTAIPTVLLGAAATALLGVTAYGILRGRLDPRARIPFGPFIALAIWIVWLVGPWMPFTAGDV
jgi:leader peptidase (prepilin peptidase) / N-methyltransferase